MVLHQAAGVRHAKQKGLRPVPGGVKANGPPQRTGSPKHKAEDQADQAGRKQAHRALAGVGGVAEAEHKRQQGGGGPEADSPGALRGDPEGGGDTGKAAGQRELQKAAQEVLLGEGHKEKSKGPPQRVRHGLRQRKQNAVKDKKVRRRERDDEQGKQNDAKNGTGQELRHSARCAAQAVGAQRTTLHAGKQKRGEQDGKKDRGLKEEHARQRLLVLRGSSEVARDGMEERVDRKKKQRQDGGKQQEAPPGAQTFRANKDGVVVRRRRGGERGVRGQGVLRVRFVDGCLGVYGGGWVKYFREGTCRRR